MSFLPAIFDHGRRKNAFLSAKTVKDKWVTGLEWILINWGLPLLAIGVTIAQGFESSSTDKQIVGQSNDLHQVRTDFRQQSNELVTTKSNFIEARKDFAKLDAVALRRKFCPESKEYARTNLAKFKGIEFVLMAQDDPESQLLTDEIRSALTRAGWIERATALKAPFSEGVTVVSKESSWAGFPVRFWPTNMEATEKRIAIAHQGRWALTGELTKCGIAATESGRLWEFLESQLSPGMVYVRVGFRAEPDPWRRPPNRNP